MALSVKLINEFIWSQPDVIQYLILSGRVFTDFSDDNCPVFAVNEQPESESPYVIYTWKTEIQRNDYSQRADDIWFLLWDTNVTRLKALQSALINYLGREDETAEAIAYWQVKNNYSGGVHIKSVRHLGSEDTFPQSQEGGVVGTVVKFRVEYVDCANNNPITDRSIV